jgi:hypothetical protein
MLVVSSSGALPGDWDPVCRVILSAGRAGVVHSLREVVQQLRIAFRASFRIVGHCPPIVLARSVDPQTTGATSQAGAL